jgi:hypothetical protein
VANPWCESELQIHEVIRIDEGQGRGQARLAQGINDLTKEEVEWLVQRAEELEKEHEWLKHELSYAENQGEVSF